MNTPIFYSFRRCPYCMRAHMALKYAQLKVILREVELSQLPPALLAVSPNSTVPSLVINDAKYIDESWDIVKWALQQNDPDNWLGMNKEYLLLTEMLVETNDFSFKTDLDHYKYAERYPEYPMESYRQHGEKFLEELEAMLEKNTFLLANEITVADISVFPFIRQFVMVDAKWFSQAPYPRLQSWLNFMLKTEWFRQAFKKHIIWELDNNNTYL